MSSVAIVTGGSGGMGGAIGLELSSRGVGTIVFAQRREAKEAVAAVDSVCRISWVSQCESWICMDN